jgi:holo-[acyl-carrier protein] synthase
MIGIDLVKIARVEKMMERFGDKALQKFLHKEEIALVKTAKTAAGFWATKEAVSKALGTGIGALCGFHDIMIYKEDSGAPKLSLSSKLIKKFAIEEAALSITHDGEYAISVVTLKSSTTDKVKQF